MLFFSGLLWIGSGWGNELRWVLMVAGVIVVALFFAWDRRRHLDNAPDVEISRHPVTVALFVGLVIAMGQIVPMSQLPMYFGMILGFGSIFGVVALGPLFVALVVAGPVAGFLLARFQPRHLIAGGMLAIGLGDIGVGLLIGPTSWYVAFILPLLLLLLVVGAGFVVATTVRTAVIFAAVPKGLPATAASLNEASIEVGSRIGIIIAVALLSQISVLALTASLAG